MMLPELFQMVESAGIKLLADGDTLRIRCPVGALTDELRTLLVEHKTAILSRFPADFAEALALLKRAKAIRPERRVYDDYGELIQKHFNTGNIIMVDNGLAGARRMLDDLATDGGDRVRT